MLLTQHTFMANPSRNYPTFIFRVFPLRSMRIPVIACIALILLFVCIGCTQQSAPPTSLPTPEITVVTPQASSAAATPVSRQIDITAEQSGSDIVVRYRGGADAGDLTALIITVQSFTQQTRTEREDKPNIGQQYIFPQMGTPDPDGVTVIGVFKDGSQQTLLQTKV